MPVLLTGGEGEPCANGVWYVPKRDPITGLQLMLEGRELGLPSRLPAARDLAKEIAGMGVTIGEPGRVKYGGSREGEHDDLVIATGAGVLADMADGAWDLGDEEFGVGVNGKAKHLESEWRSTAGRDVAHVAVASHMVRFFIRPHIVDAPEEVHKQKASGIQNTPAGCGLESAHSRPKWGLL